MSEVKHAPGPWEVRLANGTHYVLALDQDGEPWTVCYAETPTIPGSEPEANARLIAAAPDLLDALKRALQQYDCFDVSEVHEVFGEDDAEFVSIARAAIAKAEGR